MVRQPLKIPLPTGDTLHLLRLCGNPRGPVVFMLHGAIESGRIFYSDSGKGLAPYLASHGFDVYVADLRGRGESAPAIGRGSRFGQTEAIVEDIPALVEAIVKLRGPVPQQWVAHSWGGIILSSVLARFPRYLETVNSLVYFGSKRTVRARNLERLVKVDLIWNGICHLVTAVAGYLPARRLGIGSESETRKSHWQSSEWVRKDAWVDSDDGFDYGTAIGKVKLPPAWYLAGKNDRALGHPEDVRRFMESAGRQPSCYTILAKENGYLHDYGHIDMLTHPDAVRDHFPQVLEWLRQHAGGKAESPSPGLRPPFPLPD
ncbi:alpha/beta hydrolase [Geomonas sp. Red276]